MTFSRSSHGRWYALLLRLQSALVALPFKTVDSLYQANGDEAVVMFNRHTAARNISLHWEQLGLHPPWRPCSIRDLDSHIVLATAQQYRIMLLTPAHGVRALRFTCGAVSPGPVPERPPPLPPALVVAPPPPPWVSDALLHSLDSFCRSSLTGRISFGLAPGSTASACIRPGGAAMRGG